VIGISKIKAVRRGGLMIASVLLVAAFALPSSALAKGECSRTNSDPTAAQYCSPGGTHNTNNNEVKGANGAGGNENGPAGTETSVEPAPAAEVTAVEESSSSSLPFTGLDVGVLAAVALALAGTGLFLRRLSAPRDIRS
jgi:hypothetical protein